MMKLVKFKNFTFHVAIKKHFVMYYHVVRLDVSTISHLEFVCNSKWVIHLQANVNSRT